MKRKDDMFRYLGQIFILFGASVMILSVLGCFVGEEAKAHSSIFALGDQGLSLSTLAQLLLISVNITSLRFILFTDGLISRISLVVCICLMSFIVVLMLVLFAKIFGWFPLNDLRAWGNFFACIAILSFVSAYIMAWKTDRENKEMVEALRKL